MGGALRELIASFGISVDSKELEHGHKEVEGFKETLAEFGRGIAEAFGLYEIKEFVQGTVEAGARLGDLSERLGVSSGDLQAFQHAAGLAGVDAEGAAHSLGLLNRTIGEALVSGGEAAQTFAKLGINLKGPTGAARDVNEVLLDIAGAMEELPDQQTRAAYAMKLFGREGQALLPVLGKGRTELAATLEEFRKLGGGMSDDFVKQAKEVDDEMKRVHLATTGLKTAIVGALLPVIKPLVEWMKNASMRLIDLFRHSKILSTGLMFLGSVAGLRAIQTLYGIAKALGLVRGGVLGTLRAMAGFAGPVLLAGLLYLAFDELYTLLQGGDTLIGDALGPDKAAFIQELRGDVDTLTGTFKELLSGIGDDGTAMDGFKTIVVDTAKALKYLADLMAAVAEGGKKIGEAVGGLIFGEGKKAGVDKDVSLTPEAQKAYEALQRTGSTGYAPVGFSREREIVQQIKAQREAQASLPAPPAPGTGGQSGYSLPGPHAYVLPKSFVGPAAPGEKAPVIQQTVHNKVDVHTSSDQPQAVGDAVGSSLATPLQRANEKAYRAVRKP